MSERTTIYGNKVYLRNIMADGVVLEDMEGFKLPYCEKTKGIYITLANIAKAVAERQVEELNKNQEENKDVKEKLS